MSRSISHDLRDFRFVSFPAKNVRRKLNALCQFSRLTVFIVSREGERLDDEGSFTNRDLHAGRSLISLTASARLPSGVAE